MVMVVNTTLQLLLEVIKRLDKFIGSPLVVLDKTAVSEELLSGVAAFGEALPCTLEAALSRIIIVVRKSAKRAL